MSYIQTCIKKTFASKPKQVTRTTCSVSLMKCLVSLHLRTVIMTLHERFAEGR